MFKVSVKFGALTVILSAVALSALTLTALSPSAYAGDIPQAVKDACSGDYKKHCHMHKPESDDARDCMAGAFDKLSDPCVTAILNSDLVEQDAPRTETAETAEPAKQDTQVAAAPVRATEVKKVLRAEKRRNKRYAQAHRAKTAHRGRVSGPNKVARYINRGTRIANFYVSRALSKAFR